MVTRSKTAANALRSTAVFVWCLLLLTAATSRIVAADLWQMNSLSLESFEFEGVSLGAGASELRQRVPSARFAYDELDAQSGLERYTAGATKTADGASFYFYRDALYQVNVEYDKARAEAAGGMAVMIDNLIAKMGPPDYADYWRRTWYQPGCNRRADFFVSEAGGKLVVTDTSRSLLIDRHLHENEPKKVVDFGFEPAKR